MVYSTRQYAQMHKCTNARIDGCTDVLVVGEGRTFIMPVGGARTAHILCYPKKIAKWLGHGVKLTCPGRWVYKLKHSIREAK